MNNESAATASNDVLIGKPWPSPIKSWWILIVFFIAGILSYTDRFILSLLVDPIKTEFNISDTHISLLQGMAFALIYSIAGLPFGRFADVLNRRAVIISGITVWSIATAACGLAQNFEQLFVARMLVGIGEAALAPAAVSIIADSFPVQKRGTAFGVFLMGMALGSGASIVVGGFMLQTAINGAFDTLPFVGSLVPWRQVLVLLCIPGFLVTLLILTFKEPERRGTESNNGPLPIKDVAKIFIKYSPVILPLYCAVALASAGDVAFQTWLPSALTRQFHLTPGEIGGTLGILAMLAGAAGAASGGMLSDRTIKHGIRIRILIAVIFILIGLSGAAVVLAKNVPAVLTMFVIWLLTTAISKTIGITLIQEIMPNEARGMASAMVSFFNMIIGLGLGTTMTAVFTDHIYKNPQMVSASISSVAIPAGLLSVCLFLLARYNAKKLAPKE